LPHKIGEAPHSDGKGEKEISNVFKVATVLPDDENPEDQTGHGIDQAAENAENYHEGESL